MASAHDSRPDGACSSDLRRERWQARRTLHKVSSIERVRECGRSTHGDSVGIALRDDRAHFTGLTTCGSVWACPVCSARIWAERGDELATAIGAHRARGGTVVMVTLTMRHKRSDKLCDLWDALSDAWTAARGGYSGSRAALADAGCTGWVRAIEATHGANGWHLHVHALMFLSPGPAGLVDRLSADELNSHRDRGVAAMGAGMFAAWAKRLHRAGFRPLRDSGGLDVAIVTGEDAIAAYMSKATFSEASAAGEATGQHSKRAAFGNRTPWGILSTIARTGQLASRPVDPDAPGARAKLSADGALWREWERTSRGRRALTWSQGLRDELVSEPERSDDDIAAEHDDDRIVVALLPVSTWRELRDRRGAPCELLALAEAAGLAGAADAIDAGLARLGLPAANRPPPAAPA
jgi:hypothetical protein